MEEKETIFCQHCGAKIAKDADFCKKCGKFTDAGKATAAPKASDASNDKFMGVLAYLGPLCLVPFFAAKDSKFAQFHAKQGMNLLIVWVAYVIVTLLLGLIKVRKTCYLWGVPYDCSGTPWWVSLISWILSIGISVFAVIGIINVVKGKEKELPVIGQLKIFK